MKTLDAWAADEHIDIGFLVFPRLKLGRLEFDRFVLTFEPSTTSAAPRQGAFRPRRVSIPTPSRTCSTPKGSSPSSGGRRTRASRPSGCPRSIASGGGLLRGRQFVDVATLDWSVSLGTRSRFASASPERTSRRCGAPGFRSSARTSTPSRATGRGPTGPSRRVRRVIAGGRRGRGGAMTRSFSSPGGRAGDALPLRRRRVGRSNARRGVPLWHLHRQCHRLLSHRPGLPDRHLDDARLADPAPDAHDRVHGRPHERTRASTTRRRSCCASGGGPPV